MTNHRDFTYANYKKMLITILRSHHIFSFWDAWGIGKTITNIDKFLILRHDVEQSPYRALALAEIEKSLDVRSTFFFLLTGPYNIFERRQADCIQKIIDLGHDIGIHYDGAYLAERGLSEHQLLKQMQLVESFFDIVVHAVSLHQPSRAKASIKLPGVLDVYDPFYLSEIKYLSDSLQTWREGSPETLLHKYRHIHLLIHECTWSADGESWQETIYNDALFDYRSRNNDIDRDVKDFNQALSERASRDSNFKKRFLSEIEQNA